MKPVALLLSLVAFTSIDVKASENSNPLCSDNTSDTECQAYIAGLVEGYVASKQNYLPKQPVFESRYLERAYANRVGKSYSRLQNKQPACLPSVVDKDKIIEHLSSSTSSQALTVQLGDYLRANFNCGNNTK